MKGKMFPFLVACLLLLAITSPSQGMKLEAKQAGFLAQAGPCVPGSGWVWTSGPLMPEIGSSAAKGMAQKGIQAMVQAAGYGETDSCGTYHNFGVDFEVTLKPGGTPPGLSKEAAVKEIVGALQQKLGSQAGENPPGYQLGNVAIRHADGTLQRLNSTDLKRLDPAGAELNPSAAAETEDPSASLAAGSFYRNVYLVVLNPTLSNGQGLIEYMHWNDPYLLTQQTMDLFQTVSHNQLQYRLAATTVYSAGWPEKMDGFVYTEDTYLAVTRDHSLAHSPDGVNYYKLLSSPGIDICGRANRGEIDEVWVYNGPWFGFWESTLVGPGAYFYNSSPVPGAWTCNRLIPIMGPSFERGLSEATENFGHRSESTMSRVYGGWQQNRTATNWDRFGLVDYQSPNYTYSGCGSVHYPANGVHDYDWSNPTPAPSYCDDFALYPNLPSPPVLKDVECTTWGCNGVGFLRYWFSHFPHFAGCGPDNVSNMWWNYLSTPALANAPLQACASTPKVYLNQNRGRPGSVFTLRATGLAPASQVTVSVNGYAFPNSIAADEFGNFAGLLVTNSLSAPGSYTVTLAGTGVTPAVFQLDPAAELLPAEGTGQNFTFPAETAPAAPTGFSAQTLSQTQIKLSWTAASPYQSGYRVEQSADGATGWTEIAQLSTEVSSYSPVNLTCGTPYSFRVRAYRASDNAYSAYTTTASAVTQVCALAAPQALAASAVSETQIDLSWTDNSGDESGYRVELSLNGSTGWSEVGTTSANATSFSSAALACGTTYYFRARAYRASDGSLSAYSDTVSARTLTCALGAPSNLAAKAVSTTQNNLSWQDNAADESSFRIERSANGTSGWSVIGSPAANATTYSSTRLTCGTRYYYRARAYRSSDGSYSAYSNVAYTTTQSCQVLAPTNLVATVSGPTQVTLTWSDNAPDESSYSIERSTSGKTGWKVIASVGPDTTTYTVTGLTRGMTYYFRVRAYRASSRTYSVYSNTASAVPR